MSGCSFPLHRALAALRKRNNINYFWFSNYTIFDAFLREFHKQIAWTAHHSSNWPHMYVQFHSKPSQWSTIFPPLANQIASLSAMKRWRKSIQNYINNDWSLSLKISKSAVNISVTFNLSSPGLFSLVSWV